jgi:hypothetical protein
MPEPEPIDRRRAALIAYDVCRRADSGAEMTEARLWWQCEVDARAQAHEYLRCFY